MQFNIRHLKDYNVIASTAKSGGIRRYVQESPTIERQLNGRFIYLHLRRENV